MPSCFAKLGRAQAHLSLLQYMAESIENSDDYRVFVERDHESGDVVVCGEPLREPPIAEWGVVIGDVVHNLRSALDHLIWDLTLAAGHVPPVTMSGKWRRIAFPIELNDRRRKNEAGDPIPWEIEPPQSLWGIDPALRSNFEALQPFARKDNLAYIALGTDKPYLAPLAILHELWNVDKHRHLHLVHFAVGHKDLFGPPPTPRVQGLERLRFTDYAPVSFKGRTELGRLSWDTGPVPPEIERYIQPTIFFDIAFADGPPAYGGRVVQTLEGLLHGVNNILQRFAPHLD